ncbi:MAG: class I SAM-dependent methyltransferase [Comamonas sp.]|nr:class I SAM-dependent methyltransferase [Comamonas sp.]
MTIEAIDFGRLYRDHLAIAAPTRKTASAWDSRAAGMAAKAPHSRYTQEFVARMDLTGAASLLDIGCGPGTIALAVAPRLRHVVGLDYSPAMLDALRTRAAAQGLNYVQALHRAWEDDWSDVPVCDIAVASRATLVDDIAAALAKIDAHARRRVYLTHPASGHFTDPAIQRVIGRNVPTVPDYIYLVNILHRMGIHPCLSYLTQESRLTDAPDFDDYARRVAWSMGGLDEAETARLHAWYDRATPAQRTGQPMRWAFISWEKSPC